MVREVILLRVHGLPFLSCFNRYVLKRQVFFKNSYLKDVGNEKEGGSGKWQMKGLRPRQTRFVCLLILLSSLILCISVSAPVKKNQ
jgi:hypothetical protein